MCIYNQKIHTSVSGDDWNVEPLTETSETEPP